MVEEVGKVEEVEEVEEVKEEFLGVSLRFQTCDTMTMTLFVQIYYTF